MLTQRHYACENLQLLAQMNRTTLFSAARLGIITPQQLMEKLKDSDEHFKKRTQEIIDQTPLFSQSV